MYSSRIKKAVPKLRRSSNGMLMAPEEFDAVTDCDELYQYELIRGVLVVNPPPRSPNATLTASLAISSASTGIAIHKGRRWMRHCRSSTSTSRTDAAGPTA